MDARAGSGTCALTLGFAAVLACSPSAPARPTATPSGSPTVLAGASATATPSFDAPSPVPTFTRSPTPTPRAPSGPLKRSASVTRDGVRVTVTLERNPMPAGQPTWATTEVKNVGGDDVIWSHDGCATAVTIGGFMAAGWRPGVEQYDHAEEFKQTALTHSGAAANKAEIQFIRERYIGKGRFGCLDLVASDTIGPGEVVRQRMRWDGFAWYRLGLPRTGFVRLNMRASHFRRSDSKAPIGDLGIPIEFDLDAWVVGGRDASLMDPPEAIDAALTDARFREWVDSQGWKNRAQAVVQYVPSTVSWRVGWLFYEWKKYQLALLDARSGKVRSVFEEPWDWRRDPNP
jgi:hypothetical protein